jgi:hypothetical protein
VSDHLFEDASDWTAAAGLLPEYVDERSRPDWNANLEWSQAMFVLLARSHVDGTPFGFTPESYLTQENTRRICALWCVLCHSTLIRSKRLQRAALSPLHFFITDVVV